MKGITTYPAEHFSLWQAKLRDEISQADGKANPMLWWSKCLICQDYVACGLDTKREALEVTRAHMEMDYKEIRHEEYLKLKAQEEKENDKI